MGVPPGSKTLSSMVCEGTNGPRMTKPSDMVTPPSPHTIPMIRRAWLLGRKGGGGGPPGPPPPPPSFPPATDRQLTPPPIPPPPSSSQASGAWPGLSTPESTFSTTSRGIMGAGAGPMSPIPPTASVSAYPASPPGEHLPKKPRPSSPPTPPPLIPLAEDGRGWGEKGSDRRPPSTLTLTLTPPSTSIKISKI